VVGLNDVCANHDHMTSRHVSAHDPTRVVDSPQLATPSANAISKRQPHPPLPSSEGCGRVLVHQQGSLGWRNARGDPGSGRPKQCVFSRSFFLHPPLTPVTPRLPPPPPPSRPNASRRWFFLSFRHDSHHYHLPRIQMRAGGGYFCRFDVTATTTTSLASKCEPEVVIFVVSTRLPPPPPSRPNASRRWLFSSF